MAEQVFVICGWTSHFADDVWGKCTVCDRDICWRPHSVQGDHVCIGCALIMRKPGEVRISKDTERELRDAGLVPEDVVRDMARIMESMRDKKTDH